VSLLPVLFSVAIFGLLLLVYFGFMISSEVFVPHFASVASCSRDFSSFIRFPFDILASCISSLHSSFSTSALLAPSFAVPDFLSSVTFFNCSFSTILSCCKIPCASSSLCLLILSVSCLSSCAPTLGSSAKDGFTGADFSTGIFSAIESSDCLSL
jgi:hypothetical protein